MLNHAETIASLRSALRLVYFKSPRTAFFAVGPLATLADCDGDKVRRRGC